MKRYRRKIQELVLWLLFAVLGAAIGFILAYTRGWPLAALIICPLALAAPFLLYALYFDNITITIEKGTLYYRRAGRMCHSFDLRTCHATYLRVPDGKKPRGAHGYSLIFTVPGQEKDVRLECAPLGRNQFSQLCAQLDAYDHSR